MQRSGGDLISRDYGTGLIWTSCPLDNTGAPINDALCTGTYGNFLQAVARGHCSALNQRRYGGMTGWRLPLIQELVSLVIFDVSLNPDYYAIAAFPGAGQANLNLISDSTRLNPLYFQVGVGEVNNSGGAQNVRCVSGVPLRTGNFRLISGSSVLDMDTGLVFTRCSAGQNDPDCTGSPSTMTWQQALQYCDGLSKDGRRWRLPAFHEMMVAFRMDASLPFDSEAFPGAPGNGSYWTSTTYPDTASANQAIIIQLSIASFPVTHAPKSATFYALCVSGP
jgi:hypothetical protein